MKIRMWKTFVLCFVLGLVSLSSFAQNAILDPVSQKAYAEVSQGCKKLFFLADAFANPVEIQELVKSIITGMESVHFPPASQDLAKQMYASFSATMFSLNHQNLESAKTQAKQGLKAFDQLNAQLFAPVAPQKPALTVNEALRRIQTFRGAYPDVKVRVTESLKTYQDTGSKLVLVTNKPKMCVAGMCWQFTFDKVSSNLETIYELNVWGQPAGDMSGWVGHFNALFK